MQTSWIGKKSKVLSRGSIELRLAPLSKGLVNLGLQDLFILIHLKEDNR